MTMTSTVTQETTLADNDAAMEEIDNTPVGLDSEAVEERNKFVLWFQFFASQQKTAPYQQGRIAMMKLKIVNKVLLSNPNNQILENKGNSINRQGIINITDEDVHSRFQFVIKPIPVANMNCGYKL